MSITIKQTATVVMETPGRIKLPTLKICISPNIFQAIPTVIKNNIFIYVDIFTTYLESMRVHNTMPIVIFIDTMRSYFI